MPNYKVQFETLAKFKQGDIVTGNQAASDEKALHYLLTIGALVETDEEPFIYSSPEAALSRVQDLQLQLDEALETIEEQNKTITELKAAAAKSAPDAKGNSAASTPAASTGTDKATK